MLHRFFARFPPGSNAANIFRHTKNETTGRWHNPKYSLRRQKELVKLSQDYGVEELLPPTVKSSVARAERAALGPRLKRMMTPKGKGWERGLRSKYVYSRPRWVGGACVLMVFGGGQIGGADEGDGGDDSSYRQVAEAGTREGVEGLAEIDIGGLWISAGGEGGGGGIYMDIGRGVVCGLRGILRSCIEKHTATNCISIHHRRGRALQLRIRV